MNLTDEEAAEFYGPSDERSEEAERFWCLRDQFLDERARRIHLEHRIQRLRRELRTLNECRAFERQTERMLVYALSRIANSDWSYKRTDLRYMAGLALESFRRRMGPRE